MKYPDIRTGIKHHAAQQLQIQGINLTDDYNIGQLESARNITSDRYPYISTSDQLQPVDTGIAPEFEPISMFAWEKLFVVSNEPSDEEGYKCFYGGEYCGDAVNTKIPKQYAVINSKLVMWPDKVYFNLYDTEMKSHPLSTAPLLDTVSNGNVIYRKAVESSVN